MVLVKIDFQIVSMLVTFLDVFLMVLMVLMVCYFVALELMMVTVIFEHWVGCRMILIVDC